MDSLQVAVGKPHYVHRNQQVDKSHARRDGKGRTKREGKPVSIKTLQVGTRRSEVQTQEMQRIKELKSWLLGLLSEAQANWEEQLAGRKNSVMLMRQEHREKLMRILEYIFALRKKAYEQYKHACDRTREENCTDCHRRGLFFIEQVKNYLADDQEQGKNGKENNPKGLTAIKNKNKCDSGNGGSERPSIQVLGKDQQRGGSRMSGRSSTNQDFSNTTGQDFFIDGDKSKAKKPYSKFKRTDSNRPSNRSSVDKRTSADIKIMMGEERDVNQSRFNTNIKREDTSEPKNGQSRVRNSSQIPNSKDEANSRKNAEGGKATDDSFSKRDSRSSLRQSVLKHSARSPFFDAQFHRGQFKVIDAEQATVSTRPQGTHMARYGRLGIPRNSSGQLIQELMAQRGTRRKKSTTNARRRYIKKNSTGKDDVDIELTSSSSQEEIVRRQREEIQELLREKEFFRDDQYKKVSRYRRERMIYDILKKEILLNQGIQQAAEMEAEVETQEPRQTHYSEMSSNNDTLSREHDHSGVRSGRPRMKKYSLMQRKESLISKLALLNQQGNSFESIRGKIQEILNERGKLTSSGCVIMEEKGNTKNAIQKFLSEVLKITDLKRLMKEKFFKEADWSPKMREMHQFYTYLEYSMQAFHSKLNKTTENSWRQLSYEAKLAQTQLDTLILDNQMGDWQGLQLATLGEEHHREIECSMKYYGIDVKRLKNLNQISYQVAANKTLNPIFSSVGQRSMKEIQEITEGLYAIPDRIIT